VAGPTTRTPPRADRYRPRSAAELSSRREARRRAVRRRRRVALAALLGAVALVILAVVGLGGDDRHAASPPSVAPHAAARAHRHAAGTTRDYRRESRSISRVMAYAPYVSRGSPRKREVALTFDDGPGPLTPHFVRTLRHLRAPATFFIVGQQLNSFENGLREEVRAGFPIGDHTEQHADLARLRPGLQAKQVRDAALRIRSYGVPYPRLFRPPSGAFDAATLRVLRAQRMLAVLWTIDTGDYTRPGTRAILERAVQGAKPGAIILMHDGGGDRSQTLAAVPAIVHRLRARGFKLVTVPQMLLHDPPSRRQARPLSPGA
jgi:peptidoglycan-N-acetylglucosamine deacetylase